MAVRFSQYITILQRLCQHYNSHLAERQKREHKTTLHLRVNCKRDQPPSCIKSNFIIILCLPPPSHERKHKTLVVARSGNTEMVRPIPSMVIVDDNLEQP